MENFKKGGYTRRQGEGRREYDSYPQREDRPRRSYSSDYSDRPRRQYSDGQERPRRTFDRPDRPYDRSERSYDRTERSYDRPRRQYGNDRGHRQGGSYGERSRSYQDRSFGSHSYEDRPRRQYSDNSYDRPRRQYNNDRPVRSYSDERPSFDDFTTFSQPPVQDNRPQRGVKLRPRKKKPAQQPVVQKESGINRMISRKAKLDEAMLSDNDLINIPVKETVRLNKFIANSGICSRREADNFILAGVVTVNGEVVTELGTKININTDDVRFNGERLRGEAKVYIVMNKPKGYVTTASDPHAEKTVMDLLKGCNSRVFPVGRLDKSTTGVLMFTNDGEIAEKLTHPAYEKKKIYQVTLTSELAQEDYNKIVEGVELTDGVIAADELEYVDENNHKKIGIEIHSGKNRIVRRIFESLGYEVKGLDRVYFAGLTKKGLKRGGWRYLTDGEIAVLKMGAYR